MTISIDDLRAKLAGTALPGGELVLEEYESAIADAAFRAEDDAGGFAHPAWFIIASLRGMGISVDELCALAEQEPGDTLLFGNCEVEQFRPLTPGTRYRTYAEITDVGSRTTRDGSRLDHLTVSVTVSHPAADAGRVTSVYLFKRATEAA